jgi:hypothetical protein
MTNRIYRYDSSLDYHKRVHLMRLPAIYILQIERTACRAVAGGWPIISAAYTNTQLFI